MILTASLVDSVVVVKLDEPKAALLARALLRDVDGRGDRAEPGKVVAERVLGHVLAQAADEQLLDSHVGVGAAVVLAAHGALGLDSAAVDVVRPVAHRLVDHRRLRVGDETEPAGPGVIVSKNNRYTPGNIDIIFKSRH